MKLENDVLEVGRVGPRQDDFIEVKGRYSTQAGIIGRLGRLLWFPIAYVLGMEFKL